MGLFFLSISLRMDQFSNSVAAHLRTNESEMTPPGGVGKDFRLRFR